MDDLRFVIQQRPPQVVVGDCPFLDDLELLPSLGPLKRKLDAPNLFVQTPTLRPARVRRQEEDLDHFRLPHHLIMSNLLLICCAGFSQFLSLVIAISLPLQNPSVYNIADPSRQVMVSDRGRKLVRTLLILAANPKGTERLRLDEEVKKIEQGLERSKRRDQFKLVVKWAVTDDDLRRAMLDNEPEIVHFSGHGSGESQGGQGRDLVAVQAKESGGLAFEDDGGHVQLISGDALARL